MADSPNGPRTLGKAKGPETRLQLEVSSGVDNKTGVSSKKTRPFGQWRQEDQEFKSSLSYMAN